MLAAVHAWSFTHFTEPDEEKTSMDDNGFWDGIQLVLTGINNPRPFNFQQPATHFEEVIIQSNYKISCWHMRADSSSGTVILFHGYGGTKSSMLDKANEFLSLNYSVLLVDFMGCGDSEGNQTTIGYLEAEQVKSCIAYLREQKEENIFLFGTSMGAAAIMKALSEEDAGVKGAILECPFGSLYQTVCARFDMMNMPSFPMASLLTFWGGVENGFWAFDHEPVVYAQKIKCPVLLMYGGKDPKVSRAETDEIYAYFQGPKELIVFPEAGHENYLNQYRLSWKANVAKFLNSNSPGHD